MWLNIYIDYVNAFIGAIIALLGILLIREIRTKIKYLILTIILFIFSFIIGIIKITQDDNKDINYSNKIENLKTSVNSVMRRDSILEDKIDSNTVFFKRLEQIGIKKDSLNRPYIFNKKQFTNTIGSVGTLNQY